MISRQKLIEAVKKEYYQFINYDTELTYNRAISDAIKVIESQPPADQWIPCSERPPEEPCFYTVEDRSPYTLKRHGKPRRKVVTVKPYMWDVYDYVVAWKPIDMEPYKGE